MPRTLLLIVVILIHVLVSALTSPARAATAITPPGTTSTREPSLTLRSITETAPYMHDGVFKTLEDVIDFKDKGGQPNPHLSPLMKSLGLASEEKADLMAFLKALAGAPLKISVPKLPK